MIEASVYQGVSKGSAGYKLMAAMGWKEGDGLGANKQGIKEHVKVRKKSDSTGLGAHEAAARMRDWSLGMVNFENVLSSLKEVTSQHTSRSRGSDSSSESDAHEPPTKRNKVAKSSAKAGSSLETGGKQPAAAASPASPPAKHKKKVKFLAGASTQQQAPAPVAAKHNSKQVAGPAQKSSSASDLSSSASDSSTANSSSDSEPEQPSVQPKRPTHLGRYRRRETGKMAAAYSATDLAAILGAPATAAIKAEAIETVVTANASSSDSGAESDDEADVPSAAPAARRIRPLHQEYTRLFQDADKEPQPLPPAAAAGAVPAEVASGPAGWWVKLFVRAGTMGSMKQEIAGPSGKQHIQVSGFREQDQEALYHQAHEGKTQNRQGLGRSDQIKVAGVRVSNKSVKLGSDDEEEAGEQDQRAAEAPEGPTPEEDSGRLVIVMPKRTAAAAAVAEPGGAGAARASPSGGEGGQQEGARRSKKKKRSELDDSAVDAEGGAAADQVVVAGKGRKDKKRKQGGNASDSMPPSATAQSDAGELQVGETGKRKRSQAGEDAVVNGTVSKKDRQKGDDDSKKNKQRSPAPVGCTTATDNAAKHSTVPSTSAVVQPSTAAPTGKVSWCKVVSKVLKAQGGVMKVKKLQKAAIEAAGLAGHANGSSLVEALMAKLQRSDKFVVGPKRVELLQSAS